MTINSTGERERRVYQTIADTLAFQIKSGEFAEGSRLPSIRELSDSFGASRTSVHEALLSLQSGGLITLPRRPSRSKSRRLTTSPLRNIEWLIAEHGAITLNEISPVGCVAAAADNDICYAMLVRRQGETVLELLHRLDQAIASAAENNTLIDEVNSPEGFPSRRP